MSLCIIAMAKIMTCNKWACGSCQKQNHGNRSCDRTLTVFERAENAWVAFTFFTLWGEHSKKYNASENFITRQTFNDLITTANGLVLYFVDLVDHPNAPIVPWFLSSDHNEQLFARIRIGQYSGRRTQIDSGRVPDAMGRFNRLLEVENTLDVECNTNVFKTAHTRGKTLFPSSWSKHPDNPIVTELGRSITLKKLIESLKKGSKIGEKLFVSSSNYGQSYLLNDDGQPTERGHRLQFPQLNGTDELSDESDYESDENVEDDDFVDHKSLVTIRGKQIDSRSAITKYCNLGRTNFGAKSRRKKFFGTNFDTSIGLYRPACKVQANECNSEIVEIGQTISGVLVTTKKGKRRITVVKGKVLSISVKISKNASRKNNVKEERKPGMAVCLEHDITAKFWVKSESGSIISLDCDNLKLKWFEHGIRFNLFYYFQRLM